MVYDNQCEVELYGGFAIVATSGLQSHRFERTDFDGWVFEAVEQGSAVAIVNGVTYTANKGDLYILPDGSNHTIYPTGNADCHKIYFHVKGSLVRTLINHYHLDSICYFSNIDLAFFIKRILQSKQDEPHEFMFRLPIMLHEFILELHKFNVDKHQINVAQNIKEMLIYLNRHTEDFVSLDIMADEFSCSKIHLIRQFKAAIGITPWEYLLTQRLESAKWLLINSCDSIKKISSKLQFNDAHYFSNFFKKRTKQTPLQFRRSNSLYFNNY